MLRNQWLNWTKQLKNITVPRSIATDIADTKAVHLHVFADASSLACCAATVALVEHESGLIKGLLKSKSRISKRGISIARLELISGHMAAHLARNICHALKRWPVETAIDGQHGSPVLDSESREVLEGIRGEQSQENRPDNRRSGNSMEILSDRKKPR